MRRLEAVIAARIKAKPFARRAEIIDRVPGLADQSVAGVIAWLPELGHITNEAAAALIGAAPYDDDSGGRKGQRHIKGGRRKRNLLYIPVMGAATQHNPVLKAYYQRPIAKGKSPRSPSSLHAQADRHLEHHARARRDLESGSSRGMSGRVAQPSGGASRRPLDRPKRPVGGRVKAEAAGGGGAKRQP
jgi:Transposase IS116/IS110/IS902 family